MAKRIVKVELSPATELALLDRYGRKCSPEGAVKRAVAEVLRQQEENVPVFMGSKEFAAQQAREEEERRLAAEEAARLPPEVGDILTRFRAGEKLIDEEGREVSALEPTEDVELKDSAPVVAQFGGDNSEWYPLRLSELLPVVETVDPLPADADDALESHRRSEVSDEQNTSVDPAEAEVAKAEGL